jgi:hypothetical protein
MAESKIQEQTTYNGPIPTVFKKINASDVKVTPFQTYKSWSVISGSATSSALPLQAIYSDINYLPALGSNLTYNDAKNIDDSLQTITYFSVNHLYYKHKLDPMKTYGPTNLNRTPKFLYQSASILSFPQVRIGEGIKPASFIMSSSFEYSIPSIYGGSTYGSSLYGIASVISIPLYINSDRYGNLYNASYDTSSIISDVMFYEGFNEYFDTSRIDFEYANVNFKPGIKCSPEYTNNYGLLAEFNNNGYIKTELNGNYDRNHDYAISFWIYATETVGVSNLIMAKASSSLTPQYPFKIEVNNNFLVYTIAGSTTFKSQLISTIEIDVVNHIHVVCQKSGSTMQIWIDGNVDISATNNLLIDTMSPFTASARIDNSDPLYIGGWESNSNMTGDIDEIRIFNRALTATEIGYLANRTEGGTFMQTNHIGNIFTKQGVAVISTPDYRFNNILNLPYTASYRSTKTIYELGVLANADAGDFNMSSNISLTADDDSTYYNFVTGSAFAPYVTTIGLYDNAGQLLAIGKLAQPIRKRPDVDMNFLIRIDLDKNIS